MTKQVLSTLPINAKLENAKMLQRPQFDEAEETPEPDEHTGIILDERYKVGHKLNQGSFGTVYTVVDAHRDVALAAKFVTAPTPLPTAATGAPPGLLGRFATRLRQSIFHEAAVLRRLGPHANIVPLIHVHDKGLILGLATSDLSQLLARGKLDAEIAQGIFRQVVDAIAHCHTNGVYHLDIKPSNILVDQTAEATTIKLCDFGGSVQKTNPQDALTGTVGSIPFMAPEVLASESWTPGPVDCWALGVLLFMLHTSELPFERAGHECQQFSDFAQSGQLHFGQLHFVNLGEQGNSNMLLQLLKLQPSARMTTQALSKHTLQKENEEVAET